MQVFFLYPTVVNTNAVSKYPSKKPHATRKNASISWGSAGPRFLRSSMVDWMISFHLNGRKNESDSLIKLCTCRARAERIVVKKCAAVWGYSFLAIESLGPYVLVCDWIFKKAPCRTFTDCFWFLYWFCVSKNKMRFRKLTDHLLHDECRRHP